MGAYVDNRRATSRRPITEEEIPYLEAFGAGLKELREDRDYGRIHLAREVGIGRTYIEDLEVGARRCRRSTIVRLVEVLCSDDTPEEQAETVEALASLAGPALGVDLDPAEAAKRQRRRKRREAKAEKLAALAVPLAEVMAKQMGREIANEHIRDWRQALGLRVTFPNARRSR